MAWRRHEVMLALVALLAAVFTALIPATAVGANGESPAYKHFSPVYPVKAMRNGLEGAVVVCFSIADNGDVINPVILTSTSTIFEKPVLQALDRSSFYPGTGDGGDSYTCRRFLFRL